MFFDKMGVYGLEKIEDIIWAAIVTQDPILFVGSAGSAKTKVIEKIGEALSMRTRVYNCSAINFEDLIGYVLPNQEGTAMEVIPSPYAIHDVEALGLDELSRTRIDRQNDMLSIIRERRIQGKKLDQLKLIIAAMNPIQEVDGDSYEGAEPLDKAFAERFAWTVVFDTFMEMQDKDTKKKIISATGEGDAVGINYWLSKNDHPEVVHPKAKNPTLSAEEMDELRKELKDMLSRAAAYYVQIQESYGDSIKEYILDFSTMLSKARKPRLVSGRMAGMIFRNIVSLLAVKKAMNKNEPIETIAYEAVSHSFPDVSYSDAVNEKDIHVAHQHAKGHLSGLLKDLALAQIKEIDDAIERVIQGLNSPIDSLNFSTLTTEALEELREKDPMRANMFARALFYEIRDKNIVTRNIMSELAKEVKKIGQVGNDYSSNREINNKIEQELSKEVPALTAKAKDEKEKQLIVYAALTYQKVYPETPNLTPENLKSFKEAVNEFTEICKKVKGSSQNTKITM